MRYSKAWLLDCILLKIRSTSHYEFLRKNKYLPLPSKSTLQSYIAAIEPKYGFDPQLFVTLKEKLCSLELRERRGVLMFDEISLQQQLEYKKSTGELIGLVDYGENIQPKKYEIANHALVFLFQPHLKGWKQTIGTFSSKDAVPGAVLNKLIIEAIIHLENCGALVDGVICDGASTNRSALKHFGINGAIIGTKHFFQNPVDPSRNTFVIFDIPHIMKCIRNVFLNKRLFDTPEGFVKVEHIETVYREDIQNSPGLRIVPKLQHEHLNPNNFQKQCVATAVQLFGGSVAKGMEFYKRRGIKTLQDSDSTISFIKRLNSLFDALNRKLPSLGIRLQSSDLQEIQSAISWLNNWEIHVKHKHPVNWKKFFLSLETSQNLRISLNSILQLCDLLLTKQKFLYVLTANFNQDPLEMFFGLIRQGSGSDTHPTTLQFLYLFRLMSIGNLVQPPKRASVEIQSLDMLGKPHNISKLKKQGRQEQISEFHANLDKVLDRETWMSSKVNYPSEALATEHSYSAAEVDECLIYYLGGYITRKLLNVTYKDCLAEIKSNQSQLNSLSSLTDISSKGYLCHPTNQLFQLLRFAENIIAQNLVSLKLKIFSEIYNKILSNPNLSKYVVGCSIKEHCVNLTFQILHFFIICRLFFFTRQFNKNSKSKLKAKTCRKEAHL